MKSTLHVNFVDNFVQPPNSMLSPNPEHNGKPPIQKPNGRKTEMQAPQLQKSLISKSEQEIPKIRNNDIIDQENALHGRIAKLLGNINSMNNQV